MNNYIFACRVIIYLLKMKSIAYTLYIIILYLKKGDEYYFIEKNEEVGRGCCEQKSIREKVEEVHFLPSSWTWPRFARVGRDTLHHEKACLSRSCAGVNGLASRRRWMSGETPLKSQQHVDSDIAALLTQLHPSPPTPTICEFIS